MKLNRIKSTLIFFFAFFALLVQAQNSTEGTYYHPQQGYYTLGINGGWAYQSSDIRTNFDGFGLGLNFGKNLYYRPGAPLSFDIRGRFLYAKTLGFDGEKSFDITENRALNGTEDLDYVNYPTGLGVDQGFVFQNHRTDIGELSLEGVFRLNKLREQTGFLVGLYGGIGLDYYLTRIDQEGNDAPYYDSYANFQEGLSKSEAANRLQDGVLDGFFETNADGFEDGGKIDWMPSLGIELGYQVTPNFAIMAGHRTTFSRNNLLDGHQWADTQNDLYHYTSLGLEWNLSPREPKARKPEIDVRVPGFNPYTQSERLANIRAAIRYVNSAADVQFFVNNRQEPFDYANGNFAANFNLKPGRNEIVISATNLVGTARKLLVINWEEGNIISTPNNPTTNTTPTPSGNAPSVRFTNPSRNNTTTSETNYRVRATVSDVNSRNDITFSVNGSNRNFNYNANRDEFTADVNLRPGRNSLILRAKNRYGNDEARTTINLQERGQAPDVQINSPNNNASVTKSRIDLNATVLHVTNSRDITVLVNNQSAGSINLVSNRFTRKVNLREGNNTIIVRAQNRFGNDEERINVRYTKPVIDNPQKPPVVTINAPTNNSTVTSRKLRVNARIRNVMNKNDVRLTVNGGSVNNFSFNSLSGQLTADVNLTNGNNAIKVRGINDDGQDEQTVNVRYEAGNAPTVTITRPTQNPFTSSTQTTTVKANITHVPNKSGVQVNLNGRRVTNFSYTASGQLSVQVSLVDGNNTVRIKATNGVGSDEATANIRYNRAKKPPTVSISAPKNNATVSTGNVKLTAKVTNARKDQVQVILDGRSISNFSLNGTNLIANLSVRAGAHNVKVKATNKDGKDEQTVLFTYKAPTIAKPTVKITKPAKEGAVVKVPKANLSATTTNVKSKQEISVLLNGRSVAFTFNQRSQLISAALNLRKGANSIKVTVSNKGGEASATRKINYRQLTTIPLPEEKPEINITSISAPATNPFDPDNAKSTIIATIDHITRKTDIVFTYKGQVRTDFTFDKNTKRFQVTVDLKRGDNAFEIKATNKTGSDKESRVITF